MTHVGVARGLIDLRSLAITQTVSYNVENILALYTVISSRGWSG